MMGLFVPVTKHPSSSFLMVFHTVFFFRVVRLILFPVCVLSSCLSGLLIQSSVRPFFCFSLLFFQFFCLPSRPSSLPCLRFARRVAFFGFFSFIFFFPPSVVFFSLSKRCFLTWKKPPGQFPPRCFFEAVRSLFKDLRHTTLFLFLLFFCHCSAIPFLFDDRTPSIFFEPFLFPPLPLPKKV